MMSGYGLIFSDILNVFLQSSYLLFEFGVNHRYFFTDEHMVIQFLTACTLTIQGKVIRNFSNRKQ